MIAKPTVIAAYRFGLFFLANEHELINYQKHTRSSVCDWANAKEQAVQVVLANLTIKNST